MKVWKVTDPHGHYFLYHTEAEARAAGPVYDGPVQVDLHVVYCVMREGSSFGDTNTISIYRTYEGASTWLNELKLGDYYMDEYISIEEVRP